jgi:hypothetical protein
MTAVLDESTTHPELSPFSKIADYGFISRTSVPAVA